jgi:capsular exopolysaccharide synthesis family protein
MNKDQEKNEGEDSGFDLETGSVSPATNVALSRSVSTNATRANDNDYAGHSTAIVNDERLEFNHVPRRTMLSRHGDQIRKLRTEILMRHGYHNTAPLAFSIVSPSAGDGRSLLAAELAVSLSQLGRATLLIDADMRKNVGHSRFFDKHRQVGLAQALESGTTPDFIQVKGNSYLSVLDAGDAPTFNPTELLSSEQFYSFVTTVLNLFRFVIVDTPPFTTSSDASIVSTIVGRALTVHRAPHNTYADTRSMLDGLSRSGAVVIGGVLNRF